MTAGPTHAQARTSKQPQDTVAGCRDRAEADQLASVVVATANERVRLETSAASWSARANMLQRLDDNHEARKAQVAATASSDDKASPIRI